MFMSPIRIMRSYLEKVLSSILDVSSIKLSTFDSGRLYILRVIYFLLLIFISSAIISILSDFSSFIRFGRTFY